MAHEKFDITKLERLNDEGRFETLIPERMLEALGEPRPRTIVEIGAGTGLFAATFADLIVGSVVHAVDTEPAMIDWMSANRAHVAAGTVVPVLSTENSVPLADCIADAVVTINVHHELADPIALYAEALRLLRAGGRMLVVDWAPGDTPHGPLLQVRATPETIVEMLGSVGFTDVTIHVGLPWHTMITARRPA